MPPPAVTTRVPIKARGHSIRVKYRAIIDNPMQLLGEIIAGRQPISLIKKWDQVELDKMATKEKGKLQLPGVRSEPVFDSTIKE